jgi:hypothetical protein
MAVTLLNIHQTVHRLSSDWETFKSEVQALGLTATPGNFHLLRNHIWREFNRRAHVFYLQASPPVISPYDAGFRPADFSGGPAISNDLIGINGIDDIIGIDENDDIVLI